MFIPLSSSTPSPLWWILSALLAIISNVGFGVSIVALNAYLPSLAKESPEVVKAYAELQNTQDDLDDASQPLIKRSNYTTSLTLATSRISSTGIALGYGAGIVLLILALIVIASISKGTGTRTGTGTEEEATFGLRLAIGMSGIWWAVFSVPAMLWLPGGTRTGLPNLTVDSGEVEEGEPSLGSGDEDGLLGRGLGAEVDDAIWTDKQSLSLGKEISAAWKRLGGMLRWTEIKKLRNTFKFLAAWFLLSDGEYVYVCYASCLISYYLPPTAFTTISSTAILFGKTSLHMSPQSLILVGIIVPTSGIVGSLIWPRVQRR